MANATKNKSAGSKTGTARKTTAAKKTTTKKKTTASGKRRGRPPKKQPSDGIRVEIVLLTVLAVSILLMLSNFGVGGIVGNAVRNLHIDFSDSSVCADGILYRQQEEFSGHLEAFRVHRMFSSVLRLYAAADIWLQRYHKGPGLLH